MLPSTAGVTNVGNNNGNGNLGVANGVGNGNFLVNAHLISDKTHCSHLMQAVSQITGMPWNYIEAPLWQQRPLQC